MTTGNETVTPTLAEYLGAAQMSSLSSKQPSGGYEVPLIKFLPVGLWLFLKGAIFGRARRDYLEVVSILLLGLESVANTLEQLGIPKQAAFNEEWVFECLHTTASDGIDNYQNTYHKEPESFLDLWLTSFAPPEFDFRDPPKMEKLKPGQIRLGTALQHADSWLFAGVSLGAMFPELTEKIWKLECEPNNQKMWTDIRRYGLEMPEQFKPLPLEEMERQVLAEITTYVRGYFPELVEPLNLNPK